ncbi:MAG: glycosyltransferase [Myxococcota bacterium]
MRVVRIQSRICVGGPALHSILLSEGLSHRNGSRYDTILLGGALEPGEHSMEELADARGVEIRTVRSMRRPVRPSADAAAVAELVRVLREVKPHIVHTHTAKAGAVGRLAARLAGVPIVLHTFHGHVFDGYFSKRKTQVFLQVERGLARVTDRILAISDQQRRDLVDTYRIAPSSKVGVVPLGLDLRRFREVLPRAARGPLRAEFGIPDGHQVVVTVGRMVPIKRFDLLIRSFTALSRQDVHLVLVGEGESRAELERQADGHPRIHFTGLRRDLPEIYADADLMALSSDNEGTPVAVIEALASGLPVVATDVGGVRDIMRSGMGRIVPPGQTESLTAALQAGLAEARPLQAMLRDDVVRRYSHERLLSDIERLYDGLVRDRVNRKGAGSLKVRESLR